jgi:hypothetical protein
MNKNSALTLKASKYTGLDARTDNIVSREQSTGQIVTWPVILIHLYGQEHHQLAQIAVIVKSGKINNIKIGIPLFIRESFIVWTPVLSHFSPVPILIVSFSKINSVLSFNRLPCAIFLSRVLTKIPHAFLRLFFFSSCTTHLNCSQSVTSSRLFLLLYADHSPPSSAEVKNE